MKKILSIIFIGSIGTLYAQYKTTYEKPWGKTLRDTVLMNTDHFYVGVESGMGFNIGPTSTVTPGPGIETNAAPFSLFDFSLTGSPKGFIGYAYKSHHFEGTIGTLKDRINVSLLDSTGSRVIDYRASRFFATMSVRYYYRLPIKAPRFKWLIGAEVGGGYTFQFLTPKTTFNVLDSNYTMVAFGTTSPASFQLLLGLNTRVDIKLAKNITFLVQASLLGGILGANEVSLFYTTPTPTNSSATVRSSSLNFNLTLGLKVDFFSHKSKLKTYDKYGIDDPYRDK